MVTKCVDSKGVKGGLVSVASIRVKVLRFDIDPRNALFLGNSSDLQRDKQKFPEEYSKRSSKSASDFTIELYRGQEKNSRSLKILGEADLIRVLDLDAVQAGHTFL